MERHLEENSQQHLVLMCAVVTRQQHQITSLKSALSRLPLNHSGEPTQSRIRGNIKHGQCVATSASMNPSEFSISYPTCQKLRTSVHKDQDVGCKLVMIHMSGKRAINVWTKFDQNRIKNIVLVYPHNTQISDVCVKLRSTYFRNYLNVPGNKTKFSILFLVVKQVKRVRRYKHWNKKSLYSKIQQLNLIYIGFAEFNESTKIFCPIDMTIILLSCRNSDLEDLRLHIQDGRRQSQRRDGTRLSTLLHQSVRLQAPSLVVLEW